MTDDKAEEIKVRVLTTPKTKTLTKGPIVRNGKKVSDKTKEEGQKSKKWRRAVLLLVKIAFFALVCYIVFFVVFGMARMKDCSMYPAIHDGDLLVYYRMENNFNNGDVVVVQRENSEENVMRIIASPGQSLEITEKNELLVDGQPSTFQAFYETIPAEMTVLKYPYKVSPDCYFMINDYRSNTNDSRTFGEVCRDKIKGRLITKIQVRDL